MGSNYVPYSDVYDDPDYGREKRADRRRSQEVPREDVSTVQRQQYEEYYRPRAQRQDLTTSNLTSRRGDGQRRDNRDRSADDAYYSRRRPQRQDSYSSQSDSEDDSRYDDRNRRQRDSRRDDNTALTRRTQSEKRNSQSRQYDGDIKGLVGKNLDMTPDGALAAALGAGVGAIVARRIGGNHFTPGHGSDNKKTLAGGIVGGLVANVAQAQWQKRKDDKAAKGERNQGGDYDRD